LIDDQFLASIGRTTDSGLRNLQKQSKLRAATVFLYFPTANTCSGLSRNRLFIFPDGQYLLRF
jgi:hypothetical protein